MSFLVDWFYDLLYQIGLLKKEATILVVGLDNAGKSTFLHKLKDKNLMRFTPTLRPHFMERLELGSGLVINAWDVGGHAEVRHVWKSYYVEADAVVYMVDAWEEERFDESKEELYSLITGGGEEERRHLESTLLLVVANKIDKVTDGQQTTRLQRLLELEKLAPRLRETHFQPVSLYNGTGYADALQWLTDRL